MSEFQKAAEKAAVAVYDAATSGWPENAIEEVEKVITKHFAEIEAVHKKLCELAVIVPQILEMNMQMAEQLYGRDEEGGIPIPQIVSVAYGIVDDLQVKAAIGGKDES